MIYPTTKLEQQLISDGYKIIVGLDEVGRGAWAGPVVAGAVIFDPKLKMKKGIADSKLLTANQREYWHDWLMTNCTCGIGIISPEIIDHSGIVPATRLAMEQAIAALSTQPDHLLIDALKLNLPIKQTSVIKGDMKHWTIAAGSIIAKVTRDRIMANYHYQYPQYNFHLHKGYGTAVHRQAISEHGLTEIHRRSFKIM